MNKTLNYTTQVKVQTSASEIISYLIAHKARNVLTTADGNGRITGVEFQFDAGDGIRSYRVPIRVEGLLRNLQDDKGIPPRYKRREQAERVAWRTALMWLKSNIALADAGMAGVDEVLLPWMIADGTGHTAYQLYRESLPAIEGSER